MKKKRLSDTYPELTKQWHPIKNRDLTPDTITYGSNKKIWWYCKKGHEWQSSVKSRTLQGRGCPYCTNKYVLVGETDLATTHPELIKEWHPTKNSNLTPQQITFGSNKKAWWLCHRGHEWEASVKSRTSQMASCPYCTNRYILIGETDLATTHPELTKEWHPTKNSELAPQQVTFGSNKKVWWLCPHGHEWECKILYRSYGKKCPYCKKTTKKYFKD